MMPADPQFNEARLARALRRVQSLAEGERGVLEVVACGSSAIPALRAIVLTPEPSGLYQPRCAAVDALAMLGDDNTLMELLETPIETADPVAGAGEEAVRSAAARALSQCNDSRLLPTLLRLAATWHLPGAIEVLGARRCVAALPSTIAALGDDIARPAAETALRNLGEAAAAELWRAARNPQLDCGEETESSRRRRRSALTVLGDVGSSATMDLEPLCNDADAAIAVAACRIRLAGGTAPERRRAVERLVAVLDTADLPVRTDIEESLLTHADVTRDVLTAMSGPALWRTPDTMPSTPRDRLLRRVTRRIGAFPQNRTQRVAVA